MTLDLTMISRLWQQKKKIHNLDYTKINNFCVSKYIINRLKSHLLQNGITYLQIIYLVWVNIQNIKRILTAQDKKNNNQIEKWAEDLSRYFSKYDIQMSNKHMERCLTSLIIRQIRSIPQWDAISYSLEWLLSKKLKISIGENIEKLERLFTAAGNAKWWSHYEKQYGSSS